MVHLMGWLLMYLDHYHISRSEPERRGSVVVSTSASHAPCRCSIAGPGALLGVNLALYIRDCVSLCLSDHALKAVGPFYLVTMSGEVNYPTSLHFTFSHLTEPLVVDSTF